MDLVQIGFEIQAKGLKDANDALSSLLERAKKPVKIVIDASQIDSAKSKTKDAAEEMDGYTALCRALGKVGDASFKDMSRYAAQLTKEHNAQAKAVDGYTVLFNTLGKVGMRAFKDIEREMNAAHTEAIKLDKAISKQKQADSLKQVQNELKGLQSEFQAAVKQAEKLDAQLRRIQFVKNVKNPTDTIEKFGLTSSRGQAVNLGREAEYKTVMSDMKMFYEAEQDLIQKNATAYISAMKQRSDFVTATNRDLRNQEEAKNREEYNNLVKQIQAQVKVNDSVEQQINNLKEENALIAKGLSLSEARLRVEMRRKGVSEENINALLKEQSAQQKLSSLMNPTSREAKSPLRNDDVASRTKNIRNYDAAVASANQSTNKLAGSLLAAAGLAGGLSGFTLGALAAIDMADKYQLLQSRMKYYIKEGESVVDINEKLLTVANTSRASIQDVTNLYAKLNPAIQRVGGTTKDTIAVTEAFSKALFVGGANIREASAATIQFAQAMGSGKLAGDEFRSISEASPRVLYALQDALKATAGELKKMSQDGELTSEVVSGALLQNLTLLRLETEKMGTTVGGGINILKNSLFTAVGTFDTATGASQALGAMLEDMGYKAIEVAKVIGDIGVQIKQAFSDNKELISAAGDALNILTVAYISYKAAVLASTAVTKSFVALNAAIATVTAVWKGITAAVVGFQAAVVFARASTVAFGATSGILALMQGIWVAIRAGVVAYTAAMPAATAAAAAFNAAATGGLSIISTGLIKIGAAAVAAGAGYLTAKFGLEQLDKLGKESGTGELERLKAENAAFEKSQKMRSDLLKKGFTEQEANQKTLLFRSLEGLNQKYREDLKDAEREKKGYDYKLELYKNYLNKRTQAMQENVDGANLIAKGQKTAGMSDAEKKAAEDKIKQLREFSAQYALEIADLKQIQSLVQGGMELEKAKLQVTEARKLKEDEIRGATVAQTTEMKNLLAIGREIEEVEKRRLDAIKATDEYNKKSLEDFSKKEADFLKPDQFKVGDLFGDASKSAGALINAFQEINKQQEEYNDQLATAVVYNLDLTDIEKKKSQNEIRNIGNILGATKGFFKEKTFGYKVLSAAEKAFRAFELVNQIKANKTALLGYAQQAKEFLALIATKIFGIKLEETTTLAATPGIVGANLAQGQASAVAAVANQGGGDPYTAFPRIAAMIAIMAALGFAVGGGGKSKGSFAPTNEGTGTVFGDKSAKSESIKRSIDLLAENSKIELPISAAMLRSLQNIEGNIGGLTNLLIRNNGGVPGEGLSSGVATGSKFSNRAGELFNKALTGYFDVITLGLSSFLGFDKILGSITGALFGKTKTSVKGQGLFAQDQTFAQINAEGLSLKDYVDVNIKKKSLFSSSSKNKTITSDADEGLSRQFTLVLKGFYDSVRLASKPLGENLDSVTSRLDNFVVSIGKINLKGLKGEEIQEKLEAVFGAAADSIAQAAIPGLEDFQKVGEGYFETVVRVASGTEQAVQALRKLGISAISYKEISNKQGDVAAELVRESILAFETLTGIKEIISVIGESASDISEAYTSLLNVKDAVVAIGKSASLVGTALIQGANGLDALQEGLASFVENFLPGSAGIEIQISSLARSFAAIGVQMPATRKAFVDLVNATTDPTTLGAILSLSQGMNDLFESVDEYNESVSDATGYTKEYLDALRSLKDAYDSAVKAVEDSEKKINDIRKKALDDVAAAEKKVFDLRKDFANRYIQATEAMAAAEQAVIDARVTVAKEYISALEAVNAAEETVVSARVAVAKEYIAALEAVNTAEEAVLSARKEIARKYIETIQQVKDAEKGVADSKKKIGQEYVSLLEQQKAAEEEVNKARKNTAKGLKDLAKSFRDFINDLKGTLFGLASPEQKYRNTKSEFEKLLALASSGDTVAQGKLQEAANNFLDASKEYFASSTSFFSDLDFVTSSLEGFATTLENQATAILGDLVIEPDLTELEQAQKNLADITSQVDSFLQKVNSMNIDIDLSGTFEEIKARFAEDSGVFSDYANSVAALTQANIELEKATSDAVAAGVDISQPIEQLKATYLETNDLLAAYNKAVADASVASSNLVAATVAAAAAGVDVTLSLQQLKVTYEESNSSLAAYNKAVADASVASSNLVAATAAAAAAGVDVTLSLQQLKATYDSGNNSLSNYNKAVDNASTASVNLAAALSAAQAAGVDVGKSLDALKSEYGNAVSSLADYQTALNDLKTAEQVALTVEADKYVASNDNLIAQYAEAKQELIKNSERLAEVSRAIDGIDFSPLDAINNPSSALVNALSVINNPSSALVNAIRIDLPSAIATAYANAYKLIADANAAKAASDAANASAAANAAANAAARAEKARQGRALLSGVKGFTSADVALISDAAAIALSASFENADTIISNKATEAMLENVFASTFGLALSDVGLLKKGDLRSLAQALGVLESAVLSATTSLASIKTGADAKVFLESNLGFGSGVLSKLSEAAALKIAQQSTAENTTIKTSGLTESSLQSAIATAINVGFSEVSGLVKSDLVKVAQEIGITTEQVIAAVASSTLLTRADAEAYIRELGGITATEIAKVSTSAVIAMAKVGAATTNSTDSFSKVTEVDLERAIASRLDLPGTADFSALAFDDIKKIGRELGITSSGSQVNAFATGGVFTNGVVSSPTMFNMGLMGEAGPEAIMPLARGSDGSLGVRIIGGGMGDPQTAANTAETNRQLSALVRLQQASNTKIIEKLSMMEERLDGIESKARLEAAR